MIRTRRGFTLIEVMVALTIIAVALPALMNLISAQAQGTMAIREKTLAYWIAENELTRLKLMQRFNPDETLPDRDEGTLDMTNLTWHWQLETEATEVEGFYRLDMEVSLDEHRDYTLAQLTGFIDDD